MTRRNAILLVLAAVLFVGMVYGGSELAYHFVHNGSDEPKNSTISTAVNPYAAISGSGNPLPSEAREDVAIQLVDSSVDADFNQATLLYDYDTGNYELLAYDSLGVLNITHVDNQYYAYDDELDMWEELSEEEARSFFDIDTIYFKQELVDQFISSSVFLTNSECDEALCSAWQVVYGEDDELDTLTIRVNNQTRKIYDISVLGKESDYTLRYTYRNVTIAPPLSDKLDKL